MDALDDPFSEGPVPESIEDESFDQFLQGLAEEDVLEGNLFADEPDPSVPIPLPPAAHDGSLEPPVYDIERLGIPLPVEEKQLPSAGVSGAARTKAPNRRTPQTANDRLEKLRAKNRRGQAKYREKCKVRYSHTPLCPGVLVLCCVRALTSGHRHGSQLPAGELCGLQVLNTTVKKLTFDVGLPTSVTADLTVLSDSS